MNSLLSKPLWGVWGLLALFTLCDYAWRLSGEDIDEASDNALAAKLESTPTRLTQIEADEIIQQLVAFEQKAIAANRAKQQGAAPKEPEIESQLGKNEIRTATQHFVLLGIFAQEKPFAVIRSREILTGKAELLKVSSGDLLDSYKVTNVGSSFLELSSKDNSVVQLNLFERNQ